MTIPPLDLVLDRETLLSLVTKFGKQGGWTFVQSEIERLTDRELSTLLTTQLLPKDLYDDYAKDFWKRRKGE